MPNLLKKGTDTQVELKSFTVVWEVLHIITDLAIPLVLTTFGEFVHQTVSRWEPHTAGLGTNTSRIGFWYSYNNIP